MRTLSSHVFAKTFAKLNNNMILNEKFSYGKDLVRLILAKFRLSFNDSQKQWFFGCNMNQLEDGLSHPTRVRGLKLTCCYRYLSDNCSHPTRVRGLKQHKAGSGSLSQFAPHTGAWIETPPH